MNWTVMKTTLTSRSSEKVFLLLLLLERHPHSGRRGGSGNNSLAPTPTPRNMSPASRDGILYTFFWDEEIWLYFASFFIYSLESSRTGVQFNTLLKTSWKFLSLKCNLKKSYVNQQLLDFFSVAFLKVFHDDLCPVFSIELVLRCREIKFEGK